MGPAVQPQPVQASAWSRFSSSSGGATTPHATANPRRMQLQEEVAALRAQVQRLSNLVDDAPAAASGPGADVQLAHSRQHAEQLARRAGALRLLLVEKLLELQLLQQHAREAGERQQAAEQQAADREEDTQALKAALAAANAHILQLSSTAPPETGPEPPCDVQLQLQQQRLVIESQGRQLEAANQALADLSRHLALKHDCAAFAERRAAMLQQQLADAQAASACSARQVTEQRHSCESVQEDDLPSAAAVNSIGSSSQHAELSSTQEQQQQRPLSPFANVAAAARNFVGAREAETIARLKEELREAERHAAALETANSRLATQLHGLQTVLTTKLAGCNRLDGEVKQLTKQLRQAEAAAVADQQAFGEQLERMSERLAEVQAQVAAGQQREQHVQGHLVAARSKLAQVLAALVEDATALAHHQPAQHRSLTGDMPAALAEAQAEAAAAALSLSRSGSILRLASVASDGCSRMSAAQPEVATLPPQPQIAASKGELWSPGAASGLRKLLAAGAHSQRSSSNGIGSAPAPAGDVGLAGSKQGVAVKLFEALRLGKKAAGGGAVEEQHAAGWGGPERETSSLSAARQARIRTTGSGDFCFAFEMLPGS